MVEIRQLLRDLERNRQNHELHLRVAEAYLGNALFSGSDLVVDGVLLGHITDWSAIYSAIEHLRTSLKLKSSFKGSLLLLTALLRLFQFQMAESVALETMKHFSGQEALCIGLLLAHAQICRGATLRASDTLYYLGPKDFVEAKQQLDRLRADERAGQVKSILSETYNVPWLLKGLSREAFRDFCARLHLRRAHEEETDAYIAQHYNWSADFCFDTARRLHGERMFRQATYFYGMASFLESKDSQARTSASVLLSLMGEHETAFKRLRKLLEKQPREHSLYVLSGLSAISNFDPLKLGAVLAKAKANGIGSVFLDLQWAFYHEQRNEPRLALQYYQQALATDGQMQIAQLGIDRIESVNEYQAVN